MNIGLILPQWNESMAGTTPQAGDVVEFAREAEGNGLDSLWLIDHFYFEPYLDFLEHGYELPGELQGIRGGAWECWSLLAALACATDRAELGTMVTNTAFRNPGLLANMAETVDSLSDGRVTLGLGAGDFRSEHSFHGFPWQQRVSRFEEALQIIVPMLRGERVTVEGDFYNVQSAEIMPKGPRPEGPPIMIGTMRGGPRMRRLIMEYADRWSCWLAYEDSHPERYAGLLQPMLDTAERYGRDPETLQHSVTVGLTMPGFEGLVPGATPITGTPEAVAEQLHRYAGMGVDNVAVYLQPYTRDGLDWLAAILEHMQRPDETGRAHVPAANEPRESERGF